ncbi:MAG: hypothetical protein WC618_00205 [Patescibacteria group bacterium]
MTKHANNKKPLLAWMAMIFFVFAIIFLPMATNAQTSQDSPCDNVDTGVSSVWQVLGTTAGTRSEGLENRNPANASDEILGIICQPQPRIKLPGLTFSSPQDVANTAVREPDGSVYVYIPFLGEYLAAVYKWAVGAAGIIAVLMIIVSGIQYMLPGNVITNVLTKLGGERQEESVNKAKKRIAGAIIGLILAVGSYVILWTINPELVQFKNLKVQYIRPEGGRPTTLNVACAFPLASGSLDTTGAADEYNQMGINYNFGEVRTDTNDLCSSTNNRCHTGIDIHTQPPGQVVAVAEGTVISISERMSKCDKGWGVVTNSPNSQDNDNGKYRGVGVLIFHPSLNKIINYGELDKSSVTLDVGNTVQPGALLGIASYCGMLHLEVYDGSNYGQAGGFDTGFGYFGTGNVTLNWCPREEINITNAEEKCKSYLVAGRGPNGLIDSTDLVRQLESGSCAGGANTVPVGALATCDSTAGTTIASDSTPESSIESVKNRWENAANEKNLIGNTLITKFGSNGQADGLYRKDVGRITIIYVPCSVNWNSPVELIYYFHGNNGFDSQLNINERVIPQLKAMQDANRNFIFVFPEMPWSADKDGNTTRNYLPGPGDDNDEGGAVNGVLYPSRGSMPDFAMDNFQADVVSWINTQFPDIQKNFVISMSGHSRGGNALNKIADKLNNIDSLGAIRSITFSDADYGNPETGGYAMNIYNQYVRVNHGTELNLLVEDPSLPTAHLPTQNAISLVNLLTTPPFDTPWEWIDGGDETASAGTPGALPDVPYYVQGHNNNIIYLPLNKNHEGVGNMSIAWPTPMP